MRKGLYSYAMVACVCAVLFLASGCPVTPPVASPTPTPSLQPTASPTAAPSYTAYYYNEYDWASVSAYAWTGSGASAVNLLGEWPGKPMTSLGSKWYSITVSGVAGSNIIFNNNNNGSQTADLSRQGDGSYYKGRWFNGDLRTSAPQALVDFGSSLSTSSVLNTGAFPVSIEIVPASNLAVGSQYELLHDGSAVTAAVSLTSGSAVVDIVDAMSGFSDGDVLELKVTGINSIGTTTASFLYACETSAPVGYTDNPDDDLATPADPWIPLGAFISGGTTYFRIWSPDFSNVVVNVAGTDHPATLLPAFGIYSNVYEYQATGAGAGTEYSFKIAGLAVRDPYGLMINASSKNIVMDMSGWSPTARPALTAREDSIIYEVHVRDFSIDSSWNGSEANRGKYLGMTQTGTSTGGQTTGLDHVKELGVTHVQLLPVYDFGSNMYNWGYDPVNYNIPEEQYSASPTGTTTRVSEFRQMVDGFHGNGLRVIMDVVYNHTQSTSMFSNITQKYYTGTNLSGVGNAINTDVPMVSRMIRDSLDQWVANYGIDGFRFDLLGIFHVSAVDDWGKFLNAKYPTRNILLFGEPWNGYATDPQEAIKVRYGKMPQLAAARFGVFAGELRDNIKGNTDGNTKGYIQGAIAYKNGVNGIKWGLRGSPAISVNPDAWDPQFTGDPEQTINYASAHDNYCLWDKVVYSNGRTWSLTPNAVDVKQAQFGFGILLTSQGIPFIHAGDEILRTKTANGTIAFSDEKVRNSYNAGDSQNQIRWGSWKTASYGLPTFSAVKDLIVLRKASAALRQTSKAAVDTALPAADVVADAATGVIVASYASGSLKLVLNPQTGATAAATGVDATWTRAWASTGSYGVAAGASETVPASSMAVYTK